MNAAPKRQARVGLSSYVPGPRDNKEIAMTDLIDLHNTTDASKWAKAFCKNWPTALCQIEGREGVETEDDFEAIMIGWFANAIMAGVDSQTHAEALKAADEHLVKRLKALQTYFDLDEEELASLTKDERADTIRQHRLITECLTAYRKARGGE